VGHAVYRIGLRRNVMIDDYIMENTRLLDREFISKTEDLDLQFLVQQM